MEHYQSDWRNDDNLGPLYVIDEAHLSLPRQVPSNVTQQGFGVLEGFNFYVAGWSKQLASSRGKLDPDMSFFRVYVDVYLDEVYQFTLKHTDLLKLGYDFSQMSECVFKLHYMDNSRLVTCKHREEEREQEAEPLLPIPDVI
ncbi:hypothetical protein L1D15_12040 [Vibrio sp. Isolate25]|uniref:hypothetical protein n=1 Tax=Vibrio sp. Isolate25 TaxID=2908535 RepID=UPI001EFD536B|nr:hypothetical protein [Vibrio sp. Isolate25]MCG9597449.1 hypothetical protein [Vibrio sp. Isolate25]